jgi:hypothetical protein
MTKLDLGPPAEPYSFAELCRRNPGWMGDFADTIPTAPGHLDDKPTTWPACGGACAERARPCPTPRQCWLVEREDDGIEVVRGLLWTLGLTAAVAAAGLLVAYLI